MNRTLLEPYCRQVLACVLAGLLGFGLLCGTLAAQSVVP